jgi:hypothetical protein
MKKIFVAFLLMVSAAFGALEVKVDRSGALSVAGKRVTPGELTKIATATVAGDADVEVAMVVASDAPPSVVASAFDACRKAGVKKFALTEQPGAN